MCLRLLVGAGAGLLLAFSGIAMAAPASSLNPDVAALLSEWTGPYGGEIPFDKVEAQAFKPALQEAMRLDQAEIDAIAGDPAKPTFENTIVPLERAGRALDRVRTIYGVWKSNLKTSEVSAVEAEMEPVLAAFADRIYQNDRLFARIDAVYRARERAGLAPEQQRLVWVCRYGEYVPRTDPAVPLLCVGNDSVSGVEGSPR